MRGLGRALGSVLESRPPGVTISRDEILCYRDDGVVDATGVVKALNRQGPDGLWALEVLSAADHFPITAPHLLHFEVANTVRRVEAAGRISPETALLAHADLLSLPIELAGYAPFADRAWELRASVTVYDASYVALAEALAVPLATLDGRLVRSNGPRCEFLVPS